MKRHIVFIIFTLICAALVLIGCGETISGIGKDGGRIGKGIHTIIFRDQ